MFDNLGNFFFLAFGAVAFWTFMSVRAWSETRKSERVAIERMALYRKLAESPAESVQLVLARLREEDLNQREKERDHAKRSRFETGRAGVFLVFVGIGLSYFLNSVAPGQGVWTLGIIVVLMGVVMSAFTLFGKS